jgi:predicted nucleic-acid-binding protein
MPADEAGVVPALSEPLEAIDPSLEHEPAVERALYARKDSAADFADRLIAAHHRTVGCRATATFDANAARGAGFIDR